MRRRVHGIQPIPRWLRPSAHPERGMNRREMAEYRAFRLTFAAWRSLFGGANVQGPILADERGGVHPRGAGSEPASYPRRSMASLRESRGSPIPDAGDGR